MKKLFVIFACALVNTCLYGQMFTHAVVADSSYIKKSNPITVDLKPQNAWGYDNYPSPAIYYSYEKAQIHGKEKFVYWASIPKGQVLKIQGHVEQPLMDSTTTERTLQLKRNSSVQQNFSTKDSLTKFDVSGFSTGDNTVKAVYQLQEGKGVDILAGQLNVVAYKQEKVKLIIVPIKGTLFTDGTGLQGALDDIYRQAVVNWEVTVDNSFTYTQDVYINPESNSQDPYDNSMDKVIAAYKKTDGYSRKARILFLIDKFSSGLANEIGYMPFYDQFGFVKQSDRYGAPMTTVKLARWIAHELGHGAFGLRHTFDPQVGLAENYGNLMDYTDSTRLCKFQWDIIHDSDAGEKEFGSADEVMGKDGDIKKTLNQLIETLKAVGENGCAFVRKRVSTSNTTEVYNTVTTSIDYLIGKYENDLPSFDIGLGETKVTELAHSIQIILDNDDKNWVLYVANGNVEICEAKEDYSAFTSLSEAKTDEIFLHKYKTDLLNCKYSIDSYILSVLKQLQLNIRSNQSVEFFYKGNSYTLKNGKVTISNLSDKDINTGKWTENNIDSRIRYFINDAGIIQIKAFGFRQNLPLTTAEGDLIVLGSHIKETSNVFLRENNVKNFEAIAPISTDGDAFADGGKITIGNKNTTFFKIISEGVGVVTTLVKTGEMEENTYANSAKDTAIIHAPGLLTGSFEVVAQKVTDITSIGCLVYDVSFKKEVRTELKKQFAGIKDQIAEDPGAFFPVMGEILLTVATGNTAEEWKTVVDENGDAGKRSHIVTRGTGNAIVTVLSGAALVKNLPEIGNKLSEWVAKMAKSRRDIRKILTTTVGKDYLKKYFDKFVQTGSFDEWVDKVKDFNLGKELNFEVHHIIPVNVLESNKELQRILEKFDFDFNGIDNGIPLQKKSLKVDRAGHANHPKYDEAITESVENILSNPRLDDVGKFEQIQDLINNTKLKLENDVLLGAKDVNDIINL